MEIGGYRCKPCRTPNGLGSAKNVNDFAAPFRLRRNSFHQLYARWKGLLDNRRLPKDITFDQFSIFGVRVDEAKTM
jgi:hypothetical protein